jgi:ferredoxin
MDGQVPALSAYSKNQLGPEQARLAVALRERLFHPQQGLSWPEWIDARPGRLGAIVGDCTDPPLGRTRGHLLQHHSTLLIEGLGALGLALSAPRLAVFTPDPEQKRALSQKLRSTAIEAVCGDKVFPSQPAAALLDLRGVPWVVPAETLVRAGATLRGVAPPRPCSVVGAVKAPAVLQLSGSETPRQLVRRAGGARVSAWVALRQDPFGGELWPADKGLSDGTSLVYILPAGHALARRHRLAQATTRQRAQTACLSCRRCTEVCPEAPQGTAPHRILQALARQQLSESDAAAARGCTSCGLCSLSCPAELLPSALVAALSETQPRKAEAEPSASPPALLPHLPMELVLRRLDLLRYADEAP